MSKYQNLFSPIRVGDCEIKNRTVMSPMGDGLANREGNVTEEMIAYYGARAKSGVGLIIVGSTCIGEDDANKPDQHKIFREENLRGLRRLTEGVHRYDCRIFVQLVHTGRQGNPAVMGHPTVAPSPLPVITGEIPGVPRALTIPEIHEIKDRFVKAAALAQRGGMDGVEIHAGHGYLIHGFLSPVQNQRTDEYGGSLENRTRFLREILTEVRAKVGPAYPISVRLSAVDLLPGGLEIEDSVEIAKICEKCGASMLNVSAGMIESQYIQMAGPEREQGYLVPWAEQLKKAVKIPVCAAGRFRDMSVAEDVLANDRLDLVGFGRPFIADPNFIRKAMDGREDEIRRCLSCGYCSDTNKTGGVRCSVNPVQALELWYHDPVRNGSDRKIVVIGGGPAGCEAARIFALRGFQVTLMEKGCRLGGLSYLAAIPPRKDDIHNLQHYYETILPRLGVDVQLNTEATMDKIRGLEPYAVMLATGGNPINPPIKGTDGPNVVGAHDLLNGDYKEITNSKIFVVGIGAVGIETAEWLLAKEGNKVDLADMIANPKERLSRTVGREYNRLAKEGVNFYGGHALAEVTENSVKFKRISDGEIVEFPADYVVMSLGLKPERSLYADLVAEYGNKVQLLGNARKSPGCIHDSVFDGFNAAWNLDAQQVEL